MICCHCRCPENECTLVTVSGRTYCLPCFAHYARHAYAYVYSWVHGNPPTTVQT